MNQLIEIQENLQQFMKEADINDKSNFLLGWKDQLMQYAKIHSERKLFFYRLNLGLTIPIIVISTSLSFSTIVVNNTKYYNLIVGILTSIVAILTSVQKYFKFELKESNHKTLSSQCLKLANDITYQLNLPEDMRKPMNEYLPSVKEKMDLIVTLSPSGLE